MTRPLLPTCPECGWDTARPPRDARPASLRWRRLAVLLWIIALAAIITTLLARGARTTAFSLGIPFPRVILPAITLADVQRIAAEGEGGPGLIQSVLQHTTRFRPDITDTWSVEAGFVPAVTNPTAPPLGQYEVPSNMRSIPALPRWKWEGRELLYRPPPEETGGVFTETRFRFPALAAPLAILLFLWFMIGLLVWRAERSGRDSTRVRRIRRLTIAVAALLILGLALFASPAPRASINIHTQLKQAGSSPAPAYWKRSGFHRLALKHDEVAVLSGTPNGSERLAKEILRAVGNQTGDPSSLYLATVTEPSIVMDETKTLSTTVTYKFPVLTFAREFYTRRPDFGAVEPVAHPPGPRFIKRFGFWTFVWPSTNPARPTLALSISPEMLGMLIVGIWLLALAAWLPLVGLAEWRLRRRHARGQCPRCGYPVTT